MTWMEALPPLVIITVALAGMGTLQDAVHRVAYKEVRVWQCLPLFYLFLSFFSAFVFFFLSFGPRPHMLESIREGGARMGGWVGG